LKPSTMQALVFDGEAKLRTDVAVPRPEAGEVLVAVRVAGVCSTDLEILKGYMDFRGVMGHEFVGEVVGVAAGDRSAKLKKWLHKRVVAEINCICGRCEMCRRGLSGHCTDRTVLGIDRRDGAFAEYVTVPAGNLHEVPESVSDDEAVFVEPLAAAFQVIHQVKIRRDAGVVVLGDGRLGQLVARVLKAANRRPLLVGRHAAKLEAAEKQGIQTALAEEFVARAEADFVVDATGSAGGFELAMRTVRPRGTIVLKSTFAAQTPCALGSFAPLVINEITVVGSRCGPFPEAIKALANREVDLAALLSRRFDLAQATTALRAAKDPDNIKVLIDVRH